MIRSPSRSLLTSFWVMCYTSALLPFSALTCSGAADCSHNGLCSAGSCTCDSGWTGIGCNLLHVGPVDKTKWGFNRINEEYTSWGGGVLVEEISSSKKYHMWVSENAKKCGMNSWGTNSRCVHSESMDPEGPYTRTGVVFGPMCHEPNVVKAPTGEYVMFFTGIYDGVTDVGADGTGGFSADHSYTANTVETVCDCSTGATSKSSTEAPLWSECNHESSSDPTWMSYTLTPGDDSSWSKPVLIIDPRDESSATGFADSSAAGDTIDTNFAPVEIANDGSLKALWRTWQDCPQGNTEQCSVIHTASATHWKCTSAADCKVKYKFNNANIFAAATVSSDLSLGADPAAWDANAFFVSKGIEDPFGWKDANGVYHAVFHYMVKTGGGADYDSTSHAYATDFFGKWTHTGDAFTQQVSFTDGTSTKFASCERPHFVMDPAPVALITGCNTATSDPEDYMVDIYPALASGVDFASFTLVQPLQASSTTTSNAASTTTTDSGGMTSTFIAVSSTSDTAQQSSSAGATTTSDGGSTTTTDSGGTTSTTIAVSSTSDTAQQSSSAGATTTSDGGSTTTTDSGGTTSTSGDATQDPRTSFAAYAKGTKILAALCLFAPVLLLY